MSLNGGYAMIKYNSTQEELQIAYRSKKPALFYDENQRSHWAVIEETATESVDEETQEPITLYEYSYRLLDEESNVVANPTLSGDEATLNGLEVDGTKYKVGGGSGGKLYMHHINICGMNQNWDNLELYVAFDIYLAYNTPLTFIEVRDWLYNNGFSNNKNILSVISNESTNEVSGTDKHMIIGIYSDNSFIYNVMQYTNGVNVGKVGTTFFQLGKRCVDTVTQIS